MVYLMVLKTLVPSCMIASTVVAMKIPSLTAPIVSMVNLIPSAAQYWEYSVKVSTRFSISRGNTFALLLETVECIDGSIRLQQGDDDSEGRVEVCTDDTYATIDDDSWDQDDARVVCSQLGSYHAPCENNHFIN